MVARLKLLLLVSVLVLAAGCIRTNTEVIETFNQRADKVQYMFAPDLSVAEFDAELAFQSQQWVLKGETTLPKAKEALLALTDSLLGSDGYLDSLVVLPHPSLGDSTVALVKVSVANLRREPRHSAELVDQSVMGRVVRLLKKNRGWYRVQTSYGYLGWVPGGSLHRIDSAGMQDWQTASQVSVRQLFSLVYSRPDEQSEPVTDAVLTMHLKLQSAEGGWTKVATPDGRTGYIRSAAVTGSANQPLPADTAKALIRTARSMMGIPYLWGGNSSKANDCSGFTQTVFKTNGVQLPRDARQQATVGKDITPKRDFSNVRAGDLFFFGSNGRITHVGIGLGGAEFIHQSGDVHINSLDPDAENFSYYRQRTFQKIKRVLN